MNKLTDPQPKIYAFVYEFGKNKEGRSAFAVDVTDFLDDYNTQTKEFLYRKYPEYKLGEEAREAKEKVENLRPTKKKGKK